VKAVVLQAGNKLALEDVPKPQIKAPGDLIVRVTAAAICGSDLHAIHGMLPGVGPGTIMGHEFVGVVEEVGSGVTRFKSGDRVAATPATWCGTCIPCRRGEFQHCANGGVWGGGEIFGRGLGGAQADFIRVVYGDNCLCPIPDGVPDEQAVFVGDVFGTGFSAAYDGHIKVGDTVVVYGCGPIGLGAVISAWQFGPKRVLAADMLENRLTLARAFGAETIDARTVSVPEAVREMTGGEGADVVIEAIGSPQSFLAALSTVRRGGTVSVVGLFPGPVEFPLQQLCFYGIKISMGLGNLSRMRELMGLVETKRVDLAPLATNVFPLDKVTEAYDLFEGHKELCMKVLLKP
jgi:alcohol dehydrogenase